MKITERDKVLLVLLAVILVVALAIVLPGVGVLSCRNEIAEYENDSKELEAELDELRDQLDEMGVKKEHYERHATAKDTLDSTILSMKTEATHLMGAIMAYVDPYAQDENWIDGLEYRYGVTSSDTEKIIEYGIISDVEVVENNSDIYFELDETNYTLPSAKREIKFNIAPTANCTYQTSLVMEGYDVADIGALLLFLQHMTAKGSILITDFKYYTKTEGQHTVDFTLIMTPKDSGINEYANEIRAAQEATEAA